jgi:hypothetical protein
MRLSQLLLALVLACLSLISNGRIGDQAKLDARAADPIPVWYGEPALKGQVSPLPVPTPPLSPVRAPEDGNVIDAAWPPPPPPPPIPPPILPPPLPGDLLAAKP